MFEFVGFSNTSNTTQFEYTSNEVSTNSISLLPLTNSFNYWSLLTYHVFYNAMSSIVDQLENHLDLVGELRDFLRNVGSYKERDEAIMEYENMDKSTTNMKMIDSNKTPREKINIEIDLIQRTTVFSSNPSMWI